MTQTVQTAPTFEAVNAELTFLLDGAVSDFSWTSPEGDQVWTPYITNSNPYVPVLEGDNYARPGTGKALPSQFWAAAEYAYTQLNPSDLNPYGSLEEAVGTLLVDGNLPDDRHNYIGVDCSGFVTQAVAASLRHLDVDLYDKLRIPHDDLMAYIGHNYRREHWRLYKQMVLASRESNCLTANQFTTMVCPGNDPLRAVNAYRLVSHENSLQIKADEILPGDIARFRSNTESAGHVTLVTDIGRDGWVSLAHSGRKDSRTAVGGVGYFELHRNELFDKYYFFPGLGYLSLHRLRVFDKEC